MSHFITWLVLLLAGLLFKVINPDSLVSVFDACYWSAVALISHRVLIRAATNTKDKQ